MSSCCLCKADLRPEAALTCSDCKKTYDFQCGQVKEVIFRNRSLDEQAAWICLPCRQPKKMIKITCEEEMNLTTLANLVLSLKSDIATYQSTIDSKIAGLEKSYVEIAKKLDTVVGLQKRVDDLEGVVERQNRENYELRRQLRDLEQYSRKSQLEFGGIPQNPNEKPEDLEAAVIDIANQLEVNLQSDDIEAIHRIPTRFKPSPIIVAFVNRKKRELLLNNRYKHSISYANSNKITIRESLSKHFRELLNRTKEKAEENKYDFCWFKNKQIYVKRKKDSREVIIVRDYEDLNKLTYLDRVSQSHRSNWKTPRS